MRPSILVFWSDTLVGANTWPIGALLHEDLKDLPLREIIAQLQNLYDTSEFVSGAAEIIFKPGTRKPSLFYRPAVDSVLTIDMLAMLFARRLGTVLNVSVTRFEVSDSRQVFKICTAA